MTEDLPSVLLISSDTIGERMGGSGIRYLSFARLLGREQPVTLAAPNEVTIDPPPGVSFATYTGPGIDRTEQTRRLAELTAAHDILVAQQIPYYQVEPEVLNSRYLVADLYAPQVLENLEYARVDPTRGEQTRQDDVPILNRTLTVGDFFLCASERQRDFWLGALAHAGRLEPAHAEADPELRSLIDVVPFGLPDNPPRKTGPGPRGRFDAIRPDDPVLLWNGGMWNWLDPLTAIRATGLVAGAELPLRLVFMGIRSPVFNAAEMVVVEAARKLAGEMGLLDRHVFFNDWVPYGERQNWLLEATAALTLHVANVEARYAFRTRLLDNLWCGLPVIATEGDVLADLVRDEGIGLTVPPGDVEAVAAAIRALIEPERRSALQTHIAEVAVRYTWERVSEPLLRYCRKPWRLGSARGRDPMAAYLHRVERTYDETAGYAQRLEQVIAEKNSELAARFQTRAILHGYLTRLCRRVSRRGE